MRCHVFTCGPKLDACRVSLTLALVVTLLTPCVAWSPSSLPSNEPAAQRCIARDTTAYYRNQVARASPPKTLVVIMPFRVWQLHKNVQAMTATGVPLLMIDDNGRVGADIGDTGESLIITAMATRLGWDVERCINVFYIGVIAIAMLSGAIGFVWMFTSVAARTAAVVASVLTAVVAFRYGTVHLIAPSCVFGLVPWAIYAVYRARPSVRAVLCFIIGAIAGSGNAIRSQSGTGILLFAVTLLLGASVHDLKAKLLGSGLIALGLMLPYAAVHQITSATSKYVRAQTRSDQPRIRTFWHTVYIGMGYLPNPYVPSYRDEVAIERVCEISPNTPLYSEQYERILRAQTWGLVTRHVSWALHTTMAKLLKILFLLSPVLFIRLITRSEHRMPCEVRLAFWSLILFNALPGLVAVPALGYLSGMIAAEFAFCTALIGIRIPSSPGRGAGTDSLFNRQQ